MSFRERPNRRSAWETSDDAETALWAGKSRGANAPVSSQASREAKLPSWTWDTDDTEAEVPREPPSSASKMPAAASSDRRGRAGSDRRTSPLPDLRESLRPPSRRVPVDPAPPTRSSRQEEPAFTQPLERPGRPRWPDTPWLDGEDAGAPIDDHRSVVDSVAHDVEHPGTARRVRDGRSPVRSRRAIQSRPRPQFQLPDFVRTSVAAQNHAVLGMIGLAALSLVLLATTIALKVGSLPPWIVLHLDAAGRPDRWGTANSVWRLPLMTAIVTVAGLGVAALLARRDPFAAQFLIASTLLIHVLSWMAIFNML